jgi:type IV pilus assembly protein PilW
MTRNSHLSSRGFSIVELMVAMVLGLVLLAGVLGVLYSSKVTYAENERLSRLQESARAAVEMILRDLRSGGFQGCGRPTEDYYFENMLQSPTDLTHDYSRALMGYDGSSGDFKPAISASIEEPLLPSDVVVIRGVRSGVVSFRTDVSMADGTDVVTIKKSAGDKILPATPIMISDCERSTVFAATGFTDGGTTATIDHDAGAAGMTNSDPNIGRFDLGALVSPLNTIIYYVRQDDGKPPALWRKTDDDPPVELIPGVERLEILYGVDTDGDRLADKYIPASDGTINWNNVTSASISVLVRSIEEYGRPQKSKSLQMLGATVGPFEDKFLHTAFSTTASLRNRNP